MVQNEELPVRDVDETQAVADADDITREDGEEAEEEETRIDVTIPYCRFSLGSELYFVKMPNFLSIERKPYEDEMEEDEEMDEEGRARLKLKVTSDYFYFLLSKIAVL